jgi:hypothetical protein
MRRLRALAIILALPLRALSDPAPPTPLRDTLLAHAAKSPVYLSVGDAGVFATATADGWSQSLVEGRVDAAALDTAQDLVWLARGGKLEVLDLREPAPRPVPIVESWFQKSDDYGSAPGITISGVSNTSTDTTYAGVFPVLVWKAKPRISTDGGAYAGIWPEQDAAAKKRVRKARIVGGAWLTAQAGRKARPLPAPAVPLRPARVELPKGLGECEDEEMCGAAEGFGATSWWLVTVTHSCGDACHTECLLYDPATHNLASPAAPATWSARGGEKGPCLGYVFDATGTRYLIADKVCSKIGCAAIAKGSGFAWLAR